MKYNPNIHHRRSIRLKGYDYSREGLYFITICVKNREYLFGNISDGKMILNDAGRMVETEWLKMPERFSNIRLHEFIVMPNHFHGIIEIVGATLVVAPEEIEEPNNRSTTRVAPTTVAPTVAPTVATTLGDIVGAFQSIVTVEYIRGVKKYNWQQFDGKLFQRNYWEHIIRNEKSFLTISEYIINNPIKWNTDKYNIINREEEI